MEVTTATKFGTPPARGASAVNTATVTVTDQYGDPFRGVEVLLVSSIDADNVGSPNRKVELRTRALVTGKDGRVPIPYQYKANETVLETIGAQLPGPDRMLGTDDDEELCARYSSDEDIKLDGPNGIEECDSSASSPDLQTATLQTATFYWLAEPRDARLTRNDGADVLFSRVVENTIVVAEPTNVGLQTREALITYGVGDHLYYNDAPVTLETFQDELAEWERDLADGTAPYGTPRFKLAWDHLRSASAISVLKLTGPS